MIGFGVIICTIVAGIVLSWVLLTNWSKSQRPADGDPAPTEKRERSRSRTSTFDFTEAVDKAHQILPSVKNFLKEILIHRFLSNWYASELEMMTSAHDEIIAWSAVAHSSPPRKDIYSTPPGEFQVYPTMNIAFPDLSAEYYLTFVPKSSAPIFHVCFPEWVVYGALTMYDSYGLPISSVNAQELRAYDSFQRNKSTDRYTAYSKMSRPRNDPSKVAVNLLKGCPYRGNCVVVCRFYRPSSMDLTPRSCLPEVYFIDRGSVQRYVPGLAPERPLTIAATSEAFHAGKRIEAFFSRLIVGKLRDPTQDLYGCQFFHPQAVVGCFPNSDAVYVLAWKPHHLRGMRVRLQVPPYATYRPYYGIMSIDHHSSRTVSSLSYEELGGWGGQCTVFIGRTLKDAIQGGYDSSDSAHFLLLWGDDTKGPLGVVLRYIHYMEPIKGFDEDRDTPSEARRERELLASLDGYSDDLTNDAIPGLGTIEFF